MEKVTYKPLIDHLKNSGGLYNEMYQDHELRFGAMPDAILKSWIVQVIEPIVAASARDEVEAGKVFHVFYKTLLPLIGSQLAITYDREYRSGWLMLSKNPHVVRTAPQRIVSALNGALLSLRKHKPAAAQEWIDLMGKAIPYVTTVEEFLNCGRIYAWLCGMVHLRERSLSCVNSLPEQIKALIEKKAGCKTNDLIKRWPSTKPVFTGVAGGFAGIAGGMFNEPPKVALVGEQVVATDDHVVCSVFADSFGAVLLPETPLRPEEVKASGNQDFQAFLSEYGAAMIPFDDVISSVMKDNTLILTRSSSFHLFIYGWHQ